MKVGQPVVYVQALDAGPLTIRNFREHPALVAFDHGEGVLDLVVLPFGYSIVPAHKVSPLAPGSSTAGWRHV